jgi:hypothetical protein
VAISQRHPSKYYSHLQQPSVASDDDDDNDENDDYVGSILYPRPPHPYAVTILAFFESYVRDRFAGGSMSRYVMDVYLDVRDRAWIVDFNVWGGRTDCGPLFDDWSELSALGDCARDARSAGGVGGGRLMPEMRVVTKDMKSMTYDPLSSYRGPTDVVNLLGGGGGTGGEYGGEYGGPSFEEFMKQCVRPSKM